jgi:hypothetical protein
MLLIDELARLFGSEAFDATDVWALATRNADLAAAIDAEVPRARHKDRRRAGELNVRAIRMALRRLRGLTSVTSHHYWSFRVACKQR